MVIWSAVYHDRHWVVSFVLVVDSMPLDLNHWRALMYVARRAQTLIVAVSLDAMGLGYYPPAMHLGMRSNRTWDP